jgi:hypothetical protein
MTGIVVVSLLLAGCGSSGSDPDNSVVTPGGVDNSSISETTTSEVASTSEAPGTEKVVLGVITSDLLSGNGVETVGCWFYEGDEPRGDVLFFSGYDGGFFLIDSNLVKVDKPGGKSFGVAVGEVYSNDGYEAKFSALGEPANASIESTEQNATLDITPTGGATNTFEGTLWCGV